MTVLFTQELQTRRRLEIWIWVGFFANTVSPFFVLRKFQSTRSTSGTLQFSLIAASIPMAHSHLYFLEDKCISNTMYPQLKKLICILIEIADY